MGGKRGKGKGTAGPRKRSPKSSSLQDVLVNLSQLLEWVETSLDPKTGKRRTPGSLSIFSQDNGVKVCLRDKEGQRVAFVWAPTPLEALMKAHKGLVTDALDWRPDRYAGK